MASDSHSDSLVLQRFVDVRQVDRFSSLPNEVLVRITDWLDTARDKAALTICCRQLHRLLNPVLYRFNVRCQNSSALAWAAQSSDRLHTLVALFDYGAELNDTAGSVPPENLFSPSLIFTGEEVHAVYTVLGVAAKAGNDAAVSWLLSHGARVESPVHNLCACQVHPGLLYDSLVLHDVRTFSPDSSPYWSPLHIAICQGHNSTAKLLISRGASLHVAKHGVEASTALHSAAICNNVEMIRYLIEKRVVAVDALDGRGYTPLALACYRLDDLSALECLLELGAKPTIGTAFEADALSQAAVGGYFKAAKLLVESDAQRQTLNDLLFEVVKLPSDVYLEVPPDFVSETWFDHRDALLRKLVDVGVDVNVISQFGRLLNTPMHHAVTSQRNLDAVRILLGAGVDLTIKNTYGQTPLHRAVGGDGALDMVPLLVQHGARLDVPDVDGTTPLSSVLEETYRTGSYLLLDTTLQHITSENCNAKVMDGLALETYAAERYRACRALLLHGATIQDEEHYVITDRLSHDALTNDDAEALRLLLEFFPSRFTEKKMLNLWFVALKTGLQKVSTLLLGRDDIPINCKTQIHQDTPLHLACERGILKTVKLLVEKGAEISAVNRSGRTPLDSARGAITSSAIEEYLTKECGGALSRPSGFEIVSYTLDEAEDEEDRF